MVDIVGIAYAVCKADEIVHRSEDIILCDMLGRKLGCSRFCLCLYLFGVAAAFLHDGEQQAELYMLVYAAIAQVIAENILGIDHTVAEYLYFFAVTDIDISLVHACVLNDHSLIVCERFPRIEYKLAGYGIDNRTRERSACDSLAYRGFLVKFISADSTEIIVLLIKEHIIYEYLRAFNYRRLAGTELFVYFLERLFIGRGTVLVRLILHSVFFKGGKYFLVVAVNGAYSRRRSGCFLKGTDKYCSRYLSVFIDTDPANIIEIRLILKPSTAVWDDGSLHYHLARFVHRGFIVHTG